MPPSVAAEPQTLQTQSLSEELPFPRSALALALLAVLLGRGLGQALPGSLTGIDHVISGVETTGALLTQLCAALLTAQALRTNIVVLFTQPGQLPLKLLSSLTTLLVAMTTLFAALVSQNQLAVLWAAVGAVGVAVTLSASAAYVLGDPTRRGLGLIALGVAAASLAHTAARLLALFAAERASLTGFNAARGLATLGFVLELLSLAAAWWWLFRPLSTRLRAAGASLAAVGVGVAALALRDEGWGFVLGRTLEQLSSHPDPLLPALARYSLEVWAVLTVVLCCVHQARPAVLLMVLGLCLLGRSSADVPLGAVFLLNAALALHVGRTRPTPNPDHVAEVIELRGRPN